jgi:hypothetical protein
MLVAARDAGVKRFVYAASSSTYGDHPALPKVEDVSVGRLSPYAVSKLVNELYAEVFARCYAWPSIGLRYFNVFGARQDPEGAYAAVIPRWTRALLLGEQVRINGDGETSRDFCFVDNAVQANLLAATTDDPAALNQVYNVAVDDRTTLNRLFEILRDALSDISAGASANAAGVCRFPAGRRSPFAGRHRQSRAPARLSSEPPARRGRPGGDAVVCVTLWRGRRSPLMNLPVFDVWPCCAVAVLVHCGLLRISFSPLPSLPRMFPAKRMPSVCWLCARKRRRTSMAKGVPRDYARAVKLYCDGARLGDPKPSSVSGGCTPTGAASSATMRWRPTFSAWPPSRGICSRRRCSVLSATRRRRCRSACARCCRLSTMAQDVMLPRSEAQKMVVGLVHQLAPEYGVSPRLALAVIRTESNFNAGSTVEQECAGADAADSRYLGALQRQEAL